MDREHVTIDLLSSLSGILIFISLAHYIDLNGFSAYAPLLLATGIIMLFYPAPFIKALAFTGVVSRPLLLTVSHVLVFIGAKVYLEQYISSYWIYFLIAGIILLNKNRAIAKTLFGDRGQRN